jgi:transcriptional regulator with XRE-family HTH domain
VHHAGESIGERIRQLRKQYSPQVTQRELAGRAGISVDVIRKLEQGAKRTALVGTLQKIARALDVEVAVLLGRPQRLPAETTDGRGILAIRQALTKLATDLDDADAEEPALTVADLRRQVDYCWGAYWGGRYDRLGAVLPGLIQQGQAATRQARADRPEALDLIAQIYQVTACTVAHLGYNDLGHIALERALDAAEQSNDPLRKAALLGSFAWLVQKQGRSAEAHRIVVRAAERMEPRFSTALPAEMSLWGSLVLTGATAAARDGRVGTADDLLSVARGAAARLGADRNDYEVAFGPAQVTMQSVDVAVVTGQFGKALERAEKMPADAALPLAARARHMTDVAYAHTNLAHDDQALDALLSVERIAPSWIRYQAFPRAVVQELLEHERRRNPGLRNLAGRLGVDDRQQ